jgi:hypothetical protein
VDNELLFRPMEALKFKHFRFAYRPKPVALY